MKIRPLRAEEIECRAAQVKENGVSLLLYKDARCDMRILDEVFGPFGWQRHHETVNGKEFCTVSVKDDQGEWISKQDCGTESNAEKEKGQSSDAFKRACFNWGIGRELYTAPFIWISGDKVEITNKSGKLYLKSSLVVSKIQYNENKEISGLVIEDKKSHNAVFIWTKENRAASQKQQQPVLCPICGKEIIRQKLKGEERTPEEILRSLGSCVPCYRTKKSAAAKETTGEVSEQ